MTDAPDMTGNFRRATGRDAKGNLVLLIDGSGGMDATFHGGKSHPFVEAVVFAREAYAAAPDSVLALAFGEENLPVPIHLDTDEPPLKFFPRGYSYFMPTFDFFARAYEAGDIDGPAHIVVVSDGDINEKRDETVKRLASFLKSHPEVKLDVIIPEKMSCLVDFMRDIAAEVPENMPRLFTVANADHLKDALTKIAGGETEELDRILLSAKQGTDKKVTLMSTLRFRKPGETV